MGKSRSAETNRWLKERAMFEDDLLALADEAGVLYESCLELVKSIQNYTKGIGADENKHPYGKASKAVKAYGSTMQTQSSSFPKAAEQFDSMLSACHVLRDSINSLVLAKVISFKDTECKECDMTMSMLKKANADYAKKKKQNKDQVAIEAADASLKKMLEEAKGMLGKYNKAGCELMNQLATDMKASFDAYCEAGNG